MHIGPEMGSWPCRLTLFSTSFFLGEKKRRYPSKKKNRIKALMLKNINQVFMFFFKGI